MPAWGPKWSREWQPLPWKLAWKIPWTEEPGGLQSVVLQRVRHHGAAEHTLVTEGLEVEAPELDERVQGPSCSDMLHFHPTSSIPFPRFPFRLLCL